MLLTDTAKTKETATLQKKLIEKRNLFGLGLTSLIAACSGAADGAGGGGETEEDRIAREAREQEERADALPFKAGALTNSGYSADISGGADSLIVTVKEAETTKATLTFADGAATGANTGIHKLTPNLGQYDLVISAPVIDKTPGPSGTPNPEHAKGRVFIYWDVADVADKNSTHLEIKGAKRADVIGTFAPDFLKIGGTDNKYDMIIRADAVDKDGDGATTNEGAIYILWDIVDYDEATKTIDLNPTELGKANTGATSGSLAIYGAKMEGQIGIHPPEFLQLGGKADNYDMVIRSHEVNKSDTNEGAIYILWDVEDYHNTNTGSLYHAIDLDTSITGATSGSLAILGAKPADNIGISAPVFLEIGGTDNKYDMVIRSHLVDNTGDGAGSNTNEGAIYILWDVEDYYKDADDAIANKTIDLGKLGTNDENATSGSLAILGAVAKDYIGTYAPEFLQIGGKEGDNKLDMVIRSEYVDKPGSAAGTNEGAICVLWDINDYTADKNKSINLTSLSGDVTSGLLTIYGAAGSGLGSSNVLYRADNKDSDVDGDTTNDLVFKDKDYTYILFGNKIAEVASDKVTSKTINLAVVQTLFGDNGAGYFKYEFNSITILDDVATAPANKADATGYRFVTGSGSDGDKGYKTPAEVQAAYKDVSKLSDADADLGVWDIA